MHGLFDHVESTQAWLTWAGLDAEVIKFDYTAIREASLNRLADCLELQLDLEKLDPLIK